MSMNDSNCSKEARRIRVHMSFNLSCGLVQSQQSQDLEEPMVFVNDSVVSVRQHSNIFSR